MYMYFFKIYVEIILYFVIAPKEGTDKDNEGGYVIRSTSVRNWWCITYRTLNVKGKFDFGRIWKQNVMADELLLSI